MSDDRVWNFEASLGLVGVPTVDGRVLRDPGDLKGPRVQQLPMPVVARPRAQWRVDADPKDTEMQPVAVLRSLSFRGEEIVGRGYFGDTVLGRHYAGALAVESVWFALGLKMLGPDAAEVHTGELMEFVSWEVIGATLENRSAWRPEQLYAPRVWLAARLPAEGFGAG
jgi:hypothetical protein